MIIDIKYFSSLSLPLTMRALTNQIKKRVKKEPDLDGPQGYNTYPHYNNGNLENGNNGGTGVQAMDLDFHGQPPTLKAEPMDYAVSGGGGTGSSTGSEHNNGSRDHLNANRPQDAASIPGARSKITPNTSAAQPLQPPKVPSIKVTKTADSSNRQDRIDQDRHHSHSKTGADRYTTKSDSKSSSLYKSNSNHLEIKGSLEISISSQAIHCQIVERFSLFSFYLGVHLPFNSFFLNCSK